MGYTREVMHGTAIFILLSGLGSVAFYLWRLLLANSLSPEEFGLFFAVFGLIAFVTGIKEFGTTSAAVKYVAQYKTQRKWKLLRETLLWVLIWQFAVYAIGAVVVVLLSKWLADFYFKDPRSVSLVLWLLLLGFFAVIENFLFMTFQGFRAIREFAMVGFLRGLFVLLLTYLMLKANWGIDSPAAGYALGTGIVVMIGVYWLSRIHPAMFISIPTLHSKQLGRIFRFGIPVTIGVVAAWVLSYADTIALTFWRPLSEVGFYNVAKPIASTLRMLPKAIALVVFPVSVELFTLRDKRLSDGVRKMQRYLMVFMLPLGLGMVAFSHVILNILFPVAYSPSSPLLQWLTISQVLGAIAIVNTSVLLGLNRPKTFAIVMVAGAAVNLVLDVCLIPSLGTLGVGIANIAAQATMLAVSAWTIHIVLPRTTPLVSWIKTAFAGVAMYFAIEFSKNLVTNPYLNVTIAGSVGVAVYAIALLVLRVVDLKEVRQLLRVGLSRA